MTIDFKSIQNEIDYHFENPDLLQQAFIRRSYSEEMGGENNEILEFIGDKALDLAVIRILMEKFGEIDDAEGYSEFKVNKPDFFKTSLKEGQFTDIKKDLVQKKALADIMDELGFHKQLYMGYGDRVAKVNEQDSVKEDLFEAIIGAVALDSNWDMDDITKVVESMIDFDAYFDEDVVSDYVGEVQKWCLNNYGKLPKYRYFQIKGDYHCILTMDEVGSFEGYGTSKAKARRAASVEAYEYLEDEEMFQSLYEEAVGEPIEEESLRQVNELVQKNMISNPEFSFEKEYDEDGNTLWTCECYCEDNDTTYNNTASGKNVAKRMCAYELLCDLMGYDAYDEEDEYYE